MTDANDMIHVTQDEFEQLVSQDTASIGKSEKRVVRKSSPQSHGPSMK